jgi:hypothetical protein
MAKQQLTAAQRQKFSKIGRSNVRSSKKHERRIANLLTNWACNSEGAVRFRRRRVEGRDDAVRVVELVADIIPCTGDFRFAIECKKGKDFSLDSLMANPTGSLFSEWWHQCCYDAQLVSKDLGRVIHPMMFFKPHPNWDWVALSRHAVPLLRPKPSIAMSLPITHLDNTLGLWFPHLVFNHFEQLGPITHDISHSKKHEKLMAVILDPVVMCRWRDFELNVLPASTFLAWPVPGGNSDNQED